MASTGINVLRWSALAFGVFYGFSHQRTITSTQKAQHNKHEFDEYQKKIDRAKAEFAKQNAPPASPSDVITDPSDPRFDVEKLLLSVSEDKA